MTDAPKLKPLRYLIPQGDTIEQMRDAARAHPLAQEGDLTLVWVNEGDLHNHSTLWGILAPDPEVEAMIGAVLDEAAKIMECGCGEDGCEMPFSCARKEMERTRALRPEAMQALERKLREARVEGMRAALNVVEAKLNDATSDLYDAFAAIRALIDKEQGIA